MNSAVNTIDIEGHVGLVRYYARKMSGRGPQRHQRFEDLTSAGMLGLLRASELWSDSGGASFASFAKHRIVGAMLDDIRRDRIQTGAARGPNGLTQRVSLRSLDALLEEAGDAIEPEARAETSNRHEFEDLFVFTRDIAALSDREMIVLGMTIVENMTLADIGEALGLTESRVSQIRIHALKQLRQALERRKAS